jgi:hypothetical protein
VLINSTQLTPQKTSVSFRIWIDSVVKIKSSWKTRSRIGKNTKNVKFKEKIREKNFCFCGACAIWWEGDKHEVNEDSIKCLIIFWKIQLPFDQQKPKEIQINFATFFNPLICSDELANPHSISPISFNSLSISYKISWVSFTFYNWNRFILSSRSSILDAKPLFLAHVQLKQFFLSQDFAFKAIYWTPFTKKCSEVEVDR